MRLQAVALYETGEPDLIRAALGLLEQSFRDYPNAMSCALAYESAGKCAEFLGDSDLAVDYYRRALRRQKEFVGIQTNACFSLGKLAAEQDRADLFPEVLGALDDFGAPVFPWHVYMADGIRAVIAASGGDADTARSLASRALEAAEVSDSGLGWGREQVGVVKDTATPFHEKLVRLSKAGV